MQKTFKAVLFILLSCYLFSCHSTKNITGTYRSNFAVHGFFVTRINLKTDSTFGYRMSGDVIYDTSWGHYKITKDCLILSHEPFPPDTSEYAKFGKEAVIASPALSTSDHLNHPRKYIVGHKKIFVCDSTGNQMKKKFGYSRRRQYFIFGKHWYKRRYFLKRIN